MEGKGSRNAEEMRGEMRANCLNRHHVQRRNRSLCELVNHTKYSSIAALFSFAGMKDASAA
jgi:hypothetical protein